MGALMPARDAAWAASWVWLASGNRIARQSQSVHEVPWIGTRTRHHGEHHNGQLLRLSAFVAGFASRGIGVEEAHPQREGQVDDLATPEPIVVPSLPARPPLPRCLHLHTGCVPRGFPHRWTCYSREAGACRIGIGGRIVGR
ncbi:hypothetical protein OsJ_17153 [Oryza sativa Japonica Group]|uniref:Uncharacterized protein n=1 Tax=Oryza sativa subsp. japonica TaxID=39947 RepID=B9FMI1_ORYSJ|nr:hypothetical protein OsJ_17153 [Oryza sativa Japonica Group]